MKRITVVFFLLLSNVALAGGYKIGTDTGNDPRRPWWYRTTYAGVDEGVESAMGDVACLAATWWVIDGSMEIAIPSEDAWRPVAAGTKLFAASRAGSFLWWFDNQGSAYIPTILIDSASGPFTIYGVVNASTATIYAGTGDFNVLSATTASVSDATITTATFITIYIVDSDLSITKSGNNLVLDASGGALVFSNAGVEEVAMTGVYFRPYSNYCINLGAPTFAWNALYTRYFTATSSGLEATGALIIDGAISATGTIYSTGGFDLLGAGALPIGSGDVTHITVTTDGTGDAEVQLPDQSIGKDEVNNNVAGDGLKKSAGTAIAIEPADFAGTNLEDDGSDNLRIAASAAGAGLTGGGASVLAVGAGTAITVNANDVQVTANGIGADQLAATIAQDIDPDGADSYDLGDGTNQWEDGYIDDVFADNITAQGASGLKLLDDGGTNGIFVTDGGDSEVQTLSTCAAAAWTVDQNDDDQTALHLEFDGAGNTGKFIDYNGTFDNTGQPGDAGNLTTIQGDGAVVGPQTQATSEYSWMFEGMIKVEINGSTYWMPYYSSLEP